MRRLVVMCALALCMGAPAAAAQQQEHVTASVGDLDPEQQRTQPPPEDNVQNNIGDPDDPRRIELNCPATEEDMAELQRIDPDRAEQCRRLRANGRRQ